MARKPVTEYAGGKGPRQRIWEAIRARGDGDWTRYSIARAADVADTTVTTYCQALEKAGIVGKTGETAVGNLAVAGRWRLLRDEGLEAPRLRRDGTRVTLGLAQEQMWRTLRLLDGDLNARELAAHASTEAVPVTLSAAEHYITWLAAAGYLIRTRAGKGLGRRGKGLPARYRLDPARNTGPRPPMICRARVVYDPNEDEVVWAPLVTDEDAIHGA
jgi:hypothetical protein